MKIDLWELGPEIAAIRRLSVAAVYRLALNLQNRTAAGPYSWLPVISIVSAWKHLCAAEQRDTQGEKPEIKSSSQLQELVDFLLRANYTSFFVNCVYHTLSRPGQMLPFTICCHDLSFFTEP